ncbi:twin-arginine translocase TatA/TatE family subunit [Streptomyces lavendulocolor]|uniref:twin-arginine translocase TatA/TatE family subunit n=1 Tax=Streptomyces lavendulocolor TaxID=67316 RepID=UPI003C2E6628
MFGLSELAILLIVVLIFFGAKKLPELARNAGKAARILRSEAKAMKNQDPPSGDQPTPRVIKAEPSNGPATPPEGGAGHGPVRS